MEETLEKDAKKPSEWKGKEKECQYFDCWFLKSFNMFIISD
jgi:Zn-finger protein